MILRELLAGSNLFELINIDKQFEWLTDKNCRTLNTLLLARYGDCNVTPTMQNSDIQSVADMVNLLFYEKWDKRYDYYKQNLYKDGDVYEKIEKNTAKSATAESTSTSNTTTKKSSYDDVDLVETDNTANSVTGNSTGTDTITDNTVRNKKSTTYNINYENYIKNLNNCSFYDIILLDVKNTLCTFVLDLEV